MNKPASTETATLARARRFLWLRRLRGSPRAIAGGLAIGTVVAFTPTFGFQMLMALGLATLLGANRPASMIPTWLTNPITMPPVYAFTYYLGSFFWPGPAYSEIAVAMRDAASEIDDLNFLAIPQQIAVFLDLGKDVFIAMWIGGLIVGTIGAAIAYPVTLNLLLQFRATRRKRRRKRQVKEISSAQPLPPE